MDRPTWLRLAWRRMPGAYSASMARNDLAAGLTVGAMLIPQAMAYALLAGLPPEVGLFAATLPLIVYALAGSSPQLAVGPVAVASLMTASTLQGHVQDGSVEYLAAAAALAVLVGVVHLFMGVARLGSLVRVLTAPVLAGFTTAVALVIGFGQLDQLLGTSVERSDRLTSIISGLVQSLGDIHGTTVALSAGCVAMLVGLRRVWPRVPAALVVVISATAVVAAFDLDHSGVAVVGDIPGGVPLLELPDIGGGLWLALLPGAVMITLVGFVQSFAVAQVYTKRSGHAVDANRELVGIGLANMTAGVFRGYPITGGLARTAVNVDAGARTRMATVISAGVVVATLLWFTPAFRLLPRAALAAIIVVAVTRMIDHRELRQLLTRRRPDAAVLVVTLGATALLGLQLGIAVGIAASLAVRSMQRSGLSSADPSPTTRLDHTEVSP